MGKLNDYISQFEEKVYYDMQVQIDREMIIEAAKFSFGKGDVKTAFKRFDEHNAMEEDFAEHPHIWKAYNRRNNLNKYKKMSHEN